jgi:serine/threonine protein kinase
VTGPADAESPTIATVTEPGVILGTVGYMSPEQVRGRPADVRSDIFGLGAVFYEAVSGRPAFQATSSIETMIAILQEDPPLIPATKGPAPLGRIIRRCLEKSPQQRFQSARDLVYALEDLLAGATEETKLLEPREPPSGKRSRATGGAGKRSASGSAEDSGFYLIVRNREVLLRQGETLLGRGRGVTIRLQQKGVSRRHARIWIRDGEATIEDLKSKNGTYLRGERIVSPARLEDGDEIRLGSVVTILRITPATGSTATETPGLVCVRVVAVILRSGATKDLPSSDDRILRSAQDDKTPGLARYYSDRRA